MKKKARRAFVAGILLGALIAIVTNVIGGFVTSHHQVEYNCHWIAEGYACDTKWVPNA
jgi:hypothetical protein